jgi:phosphate starvation-inducible PhoH-like protein
MIVTGDTSQVDLPEDTPSGLIDALQKLRGIKGIGTVTLDRADIVRHRLVQNIVNAYERNSAERDADERDAQHELGERHDQETNEPTPPARAMVMPPSSQPRPRKRVTGTNQG